MSMTLSCLPVIIRSASALFLKTTSCGGRTQRLLYCRTLVFLSAFQHSVCGTLVASPAPFSAASIYRSFGRKSSMSISSCWLHCCGNHAPSEMLNTTTLLSVSTKRCGSFGPFPPQSSIEILRSASATLAARTDSPLGSLTSGCSRTSRQRPGSLMMGARCSTVTALSHRSTLMNGLRACEPWKTSTSLWELLGAGSSAACFPPALSLLRPRPPQLRSSTCLLPALPATAAGLSRCACACRGSVCFGASMEG
mmetsp:Transcript_72106/g.227905  ORF Transcript_72106/g.227905 Transcript_72106/m.227905 type:complete len:252 (-) Transcript_72106:421-1176(-)